jgi:hypothetical protein
MTLATVTGIAVGKLANTDKGLFVQFNWSKSHTANFDIAWYYATGTTYSAGGLKWFIGQRSNVTPDHSGAGYRYTWTAPDNAVSVRVCVRPISTTYTQKSKTYNYWTASWSSYAYYTFTAKPPTPVLEAELDTAGKAVTLKLTGMGTDTYASGREVYWQKAVDGGAWAYWRTDKITSSALTISDTLAPGHKYWYRACDKITGPATSYYVGYWSNYSEAATVITRPAAPLTDSLKAASDSSATLQWKATGWADTYTVQWSKNAGAWDTASLEEIESADGITGTVYTASGLDRGVRWFFRVQGVNETGDGDLSKIMSVVVGTVPDAPTAYATATAYRIGDSVRLSWVHNCEDESDQTDAQVRWSTDGGSSWTTKSAGKNSVYDLDTTGMADGSTVSWQVRTKGAVNTWGEWSGALTFRVWEVPQLSVALTDSGGNPVDAASSPLTSMPLNIALAAGTAAQTAVAFDVSLYAGEDYLSVDSAGQTVSIPQGTVLWSAHLDGESQATVGYGDCLLVGGISYGVTAVAVMSSGIRTDDIDVPFATQWDGSVPDPAADIRCYEDTYTARIWPRCMVLDEQTGQESSTYADCELAVWRVEADGRLVRLAYALPNDGTAAVIDPHPALGTPTYRIVATDPATGATSASDELGELAVRSIVVQWDEEWRQDESGPEDGADDYAGSMVELPYNIRIQEHATKDVVLRDYIGRTSPAAYYGTQQGVGATWTTDVIRPREPEKIAALRRLSAWMGEAYVREPDGAGYWATVDVSSSWGYDSPAAGITLTVTRTDTTDGV